MPDTKKKTFILQRQPWENYLRFSSIIRRRDVKKLTQRHVFFPNSASNNEWQVQVQNTNTNAKTFS